MTDAELIALLRAELDVAMKALRMYAPRSAWFNPSVPFRRTPDYAFWSSSGLDNGWLPAEQALADIERMEAEAGRKVNGGVVKNPRPTVDRNDPPEVIVPLRPKETPEQEG